MGSVNAGRRGLQGLRGHLAVPLFLNAYLLMISSALQSVLGLPFWALAAHLYSAKTIGDSTTIISAAALLTSVGQLGLSSVIVRYLPVAHSQSRRFVIACYGASVAACLVVTAAAVLSVGLWSPPLHFLRDDGWWCLLFVLTTTTGVIFQLEDAVMVGLHETRWVPLENGVFAVSRLVFVVLLAHLLTTSGVVLASAAPGILLPLVVNAAIFWRFLPRHQRAAGDRNPEWRLADMRKLVFGNYAGFLAEMGSLYLLPVIVTDKIGASSEAYFYIPWSVMLGLVVLGANMCSSLSVETAGGDELRGHVISTLKVISAIMVGAAVVVSVLAHPLLLVFGAKYAAHGVWALRWMMLATIPTGFSMVGLAIARIHHNGRLIATSQVITAASLLLIAFLLLPSYGIAAAGLAALLSALLSAGMLAPGILKTLAR